jgi:hypothetical protein
VSCNVRLRGRGRVELAATSFDDVEHQVVKELERLFSGVAVSIEEIRRSSGGQHHIAGEFVVRFGLRVELEVLPNRAAQARHEALRLARQRLAKTRFRFISWERIDVPNEGRGPIADADGATSAETP